MGKQDSAIVLPGRAENRRHAARLANKRPVCRCPLVCISGRLIPATGLTGSGTGPGTAKTRRPAFPPAIPARRIFRPVPQTRTDNGIPVHRYPAGCCRDSRISGCEREPFALPCRFCIRPVRVYVAPISACPSRAVPFLLRLRRPCRRRHPCRYATGRMENAGPVHCHLGRYPFRQTGGHAGKHPEIRRQATKNTPPRKTGRKNGTPSCTGRSGNTFHLPGFPCRPDTRRPCLPPGRNGLFDCSATFPATCTDCPVAGRQTGNGMCRHP